ncbi:MAG: GtrA family protein [Planctomycetes bacterium]|nr:GtrA family protein [Planctomycetota bacterium]
MKDIGINPKHDPDTSPVDSSSASTAAYDSNVLRTSSGKTAKQFLTFGLIGGSGVVVAMAVINIMMAWLQSFLIANIAAFFVAVTWNFALNRRFTFKESTHRPVIQQWAMFIGSSTFGLASNWTVSFGLYYNIPLFKEHYNLAVLCGVAAGFLVNFVCAKHIVFKPCIEADPTDLNK